MDKVGIIATLKTLNVNRLKIAANQADNFDNFSKWQRSVFVKTKMLPLVWHKT